MNNFVNAGEVAQVSIVERWQWYFGALKNPSKIGGPDLPINPGEYQLGYYRVRFDKTKPWEPVGIYPGDDGVDVAFLGDRPFTDIPRLFEWCCRHPVTYEAYVAALAGEDWPDDDPTVAAQIAPKPAGIGDNSGKIDEAVVLKDQIEAAKKGAEAYAKIADDATLAKAQSLRSRLLELRGEAVKKHKKEKEPHLEAGRVVDRKWFPLRDAADATATAIRDAMDVWETAKLRKRREEERKAEQARIAAEEKARKAEEDGKPAPAPEPAPAPAPVAVAPVPIKGTYGKAASVKAKMVVTGILNPIELFKFVAADQRVEVLLMKIAQENVDAGRTVPGVTVEERARVR